MNLKSLRGFVLLCFVFNSLGAMPVGAEELFLPAPGQMVHLSPAFKPSVLKGIELDPKNPFRFQFFVDRGDGSLGQNELKTESSKLIKYFLASITTPEKDLWVNLSPYEKNRIVPKEFGQTQMGRDLLAQDYILKQITASLIYPEDKIGQAFWKRVYEEAAKRYGTTNIPVNTFNKVWIVPDKAVVYENNGTAFVLENHLKVMLEEDYVALSHQRDRAESRGTTRDVALSHHRDRAESRGTTRDVALSHHRDRAESLARARDLSLSKHSDGGVAIPAKVSPTGPPLTDQNVGASQVLREIILPALEKEVNTGANFAQLRQVFYSLILATWYKKKIKDSVLAKVYADRNKTAGIEYQKKFETLNSKNETNSKYLMIKRPKRLRLLDFDHLNFVSPVLADRPGDLGFRVSDLNPQQIYDNYLKAFKKGVYNYIKDEPDPITQQSTPRKYFSGGVVGRFDVALTVVNRAQANPAQLSDFAQTSQLTKITADMKVIGSKTKPSPDQAMDSKKPSDTIKTPAPNPPDASMNAAGQGDKGMHAEDGDDLIVPLDRNNQSQMLMLHDGIVGSRIMLHGGPLSMIDDLLNFISNNKRKINKTPLIEYSQYFYEELQKFIVVFGDLDSLTFTSQTHRFFKLAKETFKESGSFDLPSILITNHADLRSYFKEAVKKLIKLRKFAQNPPNSFFKKHTSAEQQLAIKQELLAYVDQYLPYVIAVHAFFSGNETVENGELSEIPNLAEWMSQQVFVTKDKTGGPSKTIKVNMDKDSPSLKVMANPQLFKMALERVISNGFHAHNQMAETGVKVKIDRVSREGRNYAAVTIYNPGTLPDDLLAPANDNSGAQQLFRFNFQNINEEGIGVKFAARAIEKMGGMMKAENVKMEGTPYVAITSFIPLVGSENLTTMKKGTVLSQPAAIAHPAAGLANAAMSVHHLSNAEIKTLKKWEKQDQLGFSSKWEFDEQRIKKQIIEIENAFAKSKSSLLFHTQYNPQEKAKWVIKLIKDKKIKFKGEETHVLNGTGANARIIGRIDRGIAQFLGYPHESVNVVLISPNNEIILQLRNKTKDNYDNHLTLYGGHFGVGENANQALVTEIMQKAGIHVNKAKFIGYEQYEKEGDPNVERRAMFIVRLTQRQFRDLKNSLSKQEKKVNVSKATHNEQEYKNALGSLWNKGEGEVSDILILPIRDVLNAQTKLYPFQGRYYQKKIAYLRIKKQFQGRVQYEDVFFTPDLLDIFPFWEKVKKHLDDKTIGAEDGRGAFASAGALTNPPTTRTNKQTLHQHSTRPKDVSMNAAGQADKGMLTYNHTFDLGIPVSPNVVERELLNLQSYNSYKNPIMIGNIRVYATQIMNYVNPAVFFRVGDYFFVNAHFIDSLPLYIKGYPGIIKLTASTKQWSNMSDNLGSGWKTHLLGVLGAMIAHKESIQGKDFIDVGAGETGIIGILAAKLGARRVVFIERNKDILPALQDNLRNNGVTNFEIINSEIENISSISTKSSPVVATNVGTLVRTLDSERSQTYELASILKLFPNSPFLILGGGAHWDSKSKTEIEAMLNTAGFKLEDEVIVPHISSPDSYMIDKKGNKISRYVGLYKTPLIARPIPDLTNTAHARVLSYVPTTGTDNQTSHPPSTRPKDVSMTTNPKPEAASPTEALPEEDAKVMDKVQSITSDDLIIISKILHLGGFIDENGIPTNKFDPNLDIETANDWGFDDVGGEPLGEMMGIPRRYSMFYNDIHYVLRQKLERSIPEDPEKPFADSINNVHDELDQDTGIAGQMVWPVLVHTIEHVDYFLVALRHSHKGEVAVSDTGYSLEYEVYVKNLWRFVHHGMDHNDYRGHIGVELDTDRRITGFGRAIFSSAEFEENYPWLRNFITKKLNALKSKSLTTSTLGPITTYSGSLEKGPELVAFNGLQAATQDELIPLLVNLQDQTVPAVYRFSPEEALALSKWLMDTSEPLLPKPALLKKLLGYIGYKYVRGKHGRTFPHLNTWYRILARRWLVLYDNVFLMTEYLNNYLNGINDVSEEVIFDFMKLLLQEYQHNRDLKRQFNYIGNRSSGSETILREAILNVNKSKGFFAAFNFKDGKNIVKANIPGSEYFILARCGSWESPFGIELLLGKKNESTNPFSGKFCKIGIDTDGGNTLRIVNTQGVRRKGDESDLIAEFTKSMGVKPTFLLYRLAVDLAARFGFKDIVAVTAEHLPHQPDSLDLVPLFKQFGFNQSHPLGYARPTGALINRWNDKAQKDAKARNTLEQSLLAFSSLLNTPTSNPLIFSNRPDTNKNANDKPYDHSMLVSMFPDDTTTATLDNPMDPNEAIGLLQTYFQNHPDDVKGCIAFRHDGRVAFTLSPPKDDFGGRVSHQSLAQRAGFSSSTDEINFPLIIFDLHMGEIKLFATGVRARPKSFDNPKYKEFYGFKQGFKFVKDPQTASSIFSKELRLFGIDQVNQTAKFIVSILGEERSKQLRLDLGTTPDTRRMPTLYDYVSKTFPPAGSGAGKSENKLTQPSAIAPPGAEQIDAQMQSEALQRPGGIDLNPAPMDLQVKGQVDGYSVRDGKFYWNNQSFDPAQISGLSFTIVDMTPVSNLPQVLGIKI